MPWWSATDAVACEPQVETPEWVVGSGTGGLPGGEWGSTCPGGAKVDRAARARWCSLCRRAAAAHGSFVGKLVCKGVDELKSGQ